MSRAPFCCFPSRGEVPGGCFAVPPWPKVPVCFYFLKPLSTARRGARPRTGGGVGTGGVLPLEQAERFPGFRGCQSWRQIPTDGEKRQRAAEQRAPRCATRSPAQRRALTKRPPPWARPPRGPPAPRIPSCFPGLPISLPAAVTSRNIFGSSCRRRGDAWLAPRSRPRNAAQTSPPTPGISDVPARRRFGMATAAWPGWGRGTACPFGPIPESRWLCRATSRPAGDLGPVLFGPWGRCPAACPHLGWEQQWQDLLHPKGSAHPAWAQRCAGR